MKEEVKENENYNNTSPRRLKINLDNNRIIPSNKSSTNNIPHITNNQSSDKYISRALSIEDNEDKVDESNIFRSKIDLFYNEGIRKRYLSFNIIYLLHFICHFHSFNL